MQVGLHAGQSHLNLQRKPHVPRKAAMPRRTPRRFARANECELPREALWSAGRQSRFAKFQRRFSAIALGFHVVGKRLKGFGLRGGNGDIAFAVCAKAVRICMYRTVAYAWRYMDCGGAAGERRHRFGCAGSCALAQPKRRLRAAALNIGASATHRRAANRESL